MATAKQFKVFKKECQRLLAILLPEWDVAIELNAMPQKSWDACCSYNTQTHTACIALDKDLDKKHPDSYVKKIAAHEVFHVLLSELCEIAEFYGNNLHSDRIEHAIINRLCSLLSGVKRR